MTDKRTYANKPVNPDEDSNNLQPSNVTLKWSTELTNSSEEETLDEWEGEIIKEPPEPILTTYPGTNTNIILVNYNSNSESYPFRATKYTIKFQLQETLSSFTITNSKFNLTFDKLTDGEGKYVKSYEKEDRYRETLSTLWVEIFLNRNKVLSDQIYGTGLYQIDMPYELQGRIITPDFVIQDLGKKPHIIEFKGSRRLLSENEIQRIKYDVESKYKGVNITIIIMKTGLDLLSILHETANAPVVAKILSHYDNYIKEYPRQTIINDDPAAAGTHPSVMLRNYEAETGHFYRGMSIPDNKRTFKEFIRANLKQQGKVHDFYSDLATNPCDLVESIFPIDPVINVSKNHPYNRDLNRATFNTKKGHTSKLVLPMLVFERNESISLTSWVDHLELTPDDMALIKAHMITKQLITELNLINKQRAFLHSDQSDVSIEMVLDVNMVPAKTYLEARKILDARARLIITTFGEQNKDLFGPLTPFLKITRRGTFVLKSVEMASKYHYQVDKSQRNRKKAQDAERSLLNQLYNSEEQTVSEYVDISNINEDPILSRVVDYTPVKFDITATYHNETSQALLEFLTDKAKGGLADILGLTSTKTLMQVLTVLKDIIMSNKPMDRKTGRSNEFTVVELHTGGVLISSVIPNERTTGILKIIQLVEPETARRCLSDNLYCPWEYVGETENKVIIATPYFRLSMPVILQYEQMVFSYMQLQGLWWSIKGTVITDHLFNCLFLSFNLSTTVVMDIIYYLFKSSLMEICMGREELKTKFKAKLSLKDPRMTEVVVRLRAGYKEFSQSVVMCIKNNVKSWGLYDPLFRLSINSISDLQFLIYLKQAYFKDDGYDKVKEQYKGFLADIDHERSYNDSPFNNKTPSEELDVEVFHKLLYKSDRDLEVISRCTETIWHMTNRIYTTASSRNNIRTFDEVAVTLQFDKVKTSKVLMFDEEVYFSNRELKKAYPGLRSIGLSEALVITRELYRRDIEDYEVYVNTHYMRVRESDNYTREKGVLLDPGEYITLNDADHVTRLELSMYLKWKYPAKAILVIHPKDQHGAKRVFYQQTVRELCSNSVLDGAMAEYVSTLEEDLITKSGDEKLIYLTRLLKRTKVHKGVDISMVSIDISKYGDRYSLEALATAADALHQVGYMTLGALKYVHSCLYALWGRYVLLPSATQALIKDEAASLGVPYTQFSFIIDKTKNSLVRETLVTLLSDLWTTDPEIVPELRVLNAALTGNLYMRKHVGFVLGVLNMFGTYMSIMYARLIKETLREISPQIAFNMADHSDDGVAFLSTPCIDGDTFRLCNLRVFLDEFLISKEVFIDYPANKIILGHDTGKGSEFPLEYITSLTMCLVLNSPQHVGQYPSRGKTNFGRVCEVLQVMVSQSGVVVPLSRASSVVVKEVSYKSPTLFYSDAISRVVDIIKHGATMEQAILSQLLVNLQCMSMFGNSNKVLSFKKHTILGDGFLLLPSDLATRGVQGNEIRLMANAQKNSKEERELILLNLTDELYDFRKKIRQEDILNAAHNTSIDSIIDSNDTMYTLTAEHDEGANVEGLMAIKVDPRLRFARNRTTLKAFKLLTDFLQTKIIAISESVLASKNLVPLMLQEEINVFNQNNKNADGDMRRRIALAYRTFGIYRQYKIKSYRQTLLAFLYKFLTPAFQETYVRVLPQTKLIGMTGWQSRLWANPFNDKFNIQGIVMTISEWASTIVKMAEEGNILPLSNVAMQRLAVNLHKEDITAFRGRNMFFELRLSNVDMFASNIESMPYYDLYIKPGRPLLSKYSRSIVGLLQEYFIGKQYNNAVNILTFDLGSSLLGKIEPWTIEDPDFVTLFKDIAVELENMGLTANMIIRNQQVLTDLLGERGKRLIIKGVKFGVRSLSTVITDMYASRSAPEYSISLPNYTDVKTEVVRESAKELSENLLGVFTTALLLIKFAARREKPEYLKYKASNLPLSIDSVVAQIKSHGGKDMYQAVNSLVSYLSLERGSNDFALYLLGDMDRFHRGKPVDLMETAERIILDIVKNPDAVLTEVKKYRVNTIISIKLSGWSGIFMIVEAGTKNGKLGGEVLSFVNQMSPDTFQLILTLALYSTDRYEHTSRLNKLAKLYQGVYRVFGNKLTLDQGATSVLFCERNAIALATASHMTEAEECRRDGDWYTLGTVTRKDVVGFIAIPYRVVPWHNEFNFRDVTVIYKDNTEYPATGLKDVDLHYSRITRPFKDFFRKVVTYDKHLVGIRAILEVGINQPTMSQTHRLPTRFVEEIELMLFGGPFKVSYVKNLNPRITEQPEMMANYTRLDSTADRVDNIMTLLKSKTRTKRDSFLKYLTLSMIILAFEDATSTLYSENLKSWGTKTVLEKCVKEELLTPSNIQLPRKMKEVREILLAQARDTIAVKHKSLVAEAYGEGLDAVMQVMDEFKSNNEALLDLTTPDIADSVGVDITRCSERTLRFSQTDDKHLRSLINNINNLLVYTTPLKGSDSLQSIIDGYWREMPPSIHRENALKNLQPLNAKDTFISHVIDGYLLDGSASHFINVLNSIMNFSLWSNSRVNARFTKMLFDIPPDWISDLVVYI
jgi:hypothetical protein